MASETSHKWSVHSLVEQGIQGQVFTAIGGAGMALLGLLLGMLAPFTKQWTDAQRVVLIVALTMVAFVVGIILVAIAQSVIPTLNVLAARKDSESGTGAKALQTDNLHDRLCLALLRSSFTVGPATWSGSAWAHAITDDGGRIVYVWSDAQSGSLTLLSARVFNDDEKRTIGFMPQSVYSSETLAMQGEIVKMGDLGHAFGTPGTYTVQYVFPIGGEITEAAFFEQLGLVRRAWILVNSLTDTLLQHAMPYRLAAEAAIESTPPPTTPQSALEMSAGPQ